MPRAVTVLAPLLFAFTALAACGKDDQDPDQAKKVWDEINAPGGFRTWERAPGYAVRRPSFTAHARAVEIFVNPRMTEAQKTVITQWPVGSTIVKEGFSDLVGGKRKLVAVMKKNPDGWFWAEYDDEGEVLFSGKPSVCVDCHDNRKDHSDWVYAFELPH